VSPQANRTSPLLCSFWMGGFEGADHVNGRGEALDLVRATGHDARLDEDYRAARRLGLRCLRESIGWRLSEAAGGGAWDMGRAVRMAEAARHQRVSILWTLMHYGVPADLTLLDDGLVPRFARFAGEVARVLRPLCPGPRFYTPINEISFLSWAASATCDMGPAGMQAPCPTEDTLVSGYLVKQRLVRAALAGIAAIRRADPEARFLHVEPVVHVAPQDADDSDQRELAQRIASYQWQTLDMLAGRMEPQLGGHAGALDWLGMNHYHSSQWEVPGEKRLAWHRRDPRRQPLSSLLHDVWRRYNRPMVIAETGHLGVGRAAWLHEVAGEAMKARARGVPLQGVCLYPLLDRPDWNDTWRWHRSGLWQVPQAEEAAQPARRLNRPYARALLSWRGLNDGHRPARPAPGGEAEQAPGLLLLLPCAWEDWQAPRQLLLDAWRARCSTVRLLEPPRASQAAPLLRCHTLAPGAELMVLHGQGAASWAEAPTPAQLQLLRGALQQDGTQPWLAWLAGWRQDGHADWWRELAGGGLVVQPDATHPPQGTLMRQAQACLPPGWPGLVCRPRRAPPHSYEDDELARLLAGIPTPRVWLTAPLHLGSAQDAAALAKLGRRLQAVAWRQPQLHFLIDAAPLCDEPHPPNLHWLGPVHDSLHAALAAQVQGLLRWDADPGTGRAAASGDGHAPGPEQLAEMVDGALQPLLQRHLRLPAQA
jgi:beta-glucosidase/6-phospho-beta-glucosidase/beta-galactosidase